MTELIPNRSVAAVEGMAMLDTEHLQATQHAHTRGVRFGCAVTDGAGLDLDIAAGRITGPYGDVDVASGQSVTLTTGASIGAGEARRDAIVVDVSDGTATAKTGTVGSYDLANDEWPNLPEIDDDEILIATYWMGDGETTSLSPRIVDCRTFVTGSGRVLLTSPSVGVRAETGFDNESAFSAITGGPTSYPKASTRSTRLSKSSSRRRSLCTVSRDDPS